MNDTMCGGLNFR